MNDVDMIGEICKSPNINRLKELKDEMNDKCKVYCETGVLFGGSIILQMKSKTPCHFIGIDLFTGYYGNSYDPHRGVDLTNHIEIVKKNIEKNNPNNHTFELIKGDSKDKSVCDNVKHPIDFLFIDGCHSTLGVRMDFLNLKDKVNVGGLVVFDNYSDSSWPEVKPEADRLAEKYKDEFIIKETFGHMLVLEKLSLKT
jgi:hypothetical protein